MVVCPLVSRPQPTPIPCAKLLSQDKNVLRWEEPGGAQRRGGGGKGWLGVGGAEGEGREGGLGWV